jgi:hypothetical protein
MGERQLLRKIDRVGRPPHIGLPGIASRLAAAALLFAADLDAGRLPAAMPGRTHLAEGRTMTSVASLLPLA